MSKTKTIMLAAGCFWCVQQKFDETAGVQSTKVGYTGGKAKNPTYEEVCEGETGHYEAIEIQYNPEKISLETLLEIYLDQVDPENPYGQFCDIGTQYLLAIFYENEDEKKIALSCLEKYKNEHQMKLIHIKLLPKAEFYEAEEYHQKFYLKNSSRYQQYKNYSGRKERLKALKDKKT